MYCVLYTGQAAFIKPAHAVRDGVTFSQTFPTPSILEGISLGLGVGKIIRHRLNYANIAKSQEQIEGVEQIKRTISKKGKVKIKKTYPEQSVLTYWLLLYPRFIIAFQKESDALIASRRYIRLARKEYILLPHSEIKKMTPKQFDLLHGTELLPATEEDINAVHVGFNRYKNFEPMYGIIHNVGQRVKEYSKSW